MSADSRHHRHWRWVLLAVLAMPMAMPMPALAGPPFVTDDAEPVEYGHWEVNNALMGSLFEGGGSAAVPLIDAQYGALPDLQLHVQPRLGYVRTAAGTQFGIGDTEIGAKYRFIQEDGQGLTPMVSVYPLLEIPAGNHARGLGGGEFRTFLPIWVEKTVGKWTSYGGGGFWIDPRPLGKNAWFAGAVAVYQLADDLQLGGEAFLQTAQAPGERAAPGFNLGGRYALTNRLYLLFSAGTGLANVSATNRLSAYLALQVSY